MKKRYAIVRIDYKCPVMLEEKLKVCLSGHSCYHTEKCPYQWGDTKEQLIKKVAQVFFKRKLKSYKKLFDIVPNNEDAKQVYKCCLDVAKEIVEFLGVEE